MAFKDLNVRVGANTASANAGLNRVQDNLEEVGDEAQSTSRSFGALSSSSTLLVGALAKVRGSLEKVGDEAQSTSRSFATLSASSGVLGTSLVSLSTITIATAVPAFALLSTTLLPLTAAFGGLAAILGAIGLVGFVGVAGAAKTNTQQLKTEIQDLAAVVQSQFQPLFDAFTNVLIKLIDRLQATISELTPTQEQIDILANEFLRLGTAVIDVLPALSKLAFSLATEFAPVLSNLAENVLPTIPGLIRGLVDTFRRLQPELSRTVSVLGRLLPALFELGFTVLDVIGPKLAQIATATTKAVSEFNSLSRETKLLGVKLGLALPLASALATVVGGPLGVAIGAAAIGVGLFREELIGLAQSLIGKAQPAIATLQEKFTELKPVAEDVLAALVDGVENVIGFVSPLIDDLASLGKTVVSAGRSIARSFEPALQIVTRTIRNARGPIIRFATATRDALRGVAQFLKNTVVPVVKFVFGEIIAPIVAEAAQAFSQQLNPFIDELADTIDALAGYARTLGNVMVNVWTEIEPIVLPIVKGLADAFGDLLAGSINATMEALMGLMDLIQGDWSDAAQHFLNITSELGSAAIDAGEAISDGFVEGLESMASILTDWLSDGAAWIKRRAHGTFEKTKDNIIGLGEWVTDSFATALDLAGIAADAITEMGKEFADGALDIAGDIAQFGTDVANKIINAINDAIPDKLSFSIDAVKVAGETVVPAQTVSADIPDNPLSSAQTGGFISEGGLLNVHEGERVVPAAQVQDRGTVSVEGGSSEVVVSVEGDTEVIKDVSAQVVRNRERRAKRNTGGSNSV